MVWTNIKDGEKGGNLARVINGALLTTGGSADAIFTAQQLAAYGIGPDTPSRTLLQTADVSIATTLTHSLWGNGATTDQPLLIASTALEILSASTDDDVAGLGAQKVLIEGVDGSGNYATLEPEMDGTTPVAIGNWLEINFATVSQVGAGGSNAGAITIRTVSGSTAQAVISAANRGVLNQIRYRVPAGRVAFPKLMLYGSMGTGQDSVGLVATHMFMQVDRLNDGAVPGPGSMILTQPFRLGSYRGMPTPIPLDYTLPLFAGNVVRPVATNGTPNTVEFTCQMLIEEFTL